MTKYVFSCLAAVGLASCISGCGNGGVTEGTVPFKQTDTKQFDKMKADMMKNIGTRHLSPKAKSAKARTPEASDKPADAAKP